MSKRKRKLKMIKMKMKKTLVKLIKKGSLKRKVILVAADVIVSERVLNHFLSEKNTKRVMKAKNIYDVHKVFR